MQLIYPNEKLFYGIHLDKYNPRNTRQMRLFLLTDKAIYNIKPAGVVFSDSIQRRILLESITAITIDLAKGFIIHVKDETDYRFESNEKQKIIRKIFEAFQLKTKLKIRIFVVLHFNQYYKKNKVRFKQKN